MAPAGRITNVRQEVCGLFHVTRGNFTQGTLSFTFSLDFSPRLLSFVPLSTAARLRLREKVKLEVWIIITL